MRTEDGLPTQCINAMPVRPEPQARPPGLAVTRPSPSLRASCIAMPRPLRMLQCPLRTRQRP